MFSRKACTSLTTIIQHSPRNLAFSAYKVFSLEDSLHVRSPETEQYSLLATEPRHSLCVACNISTKVGSIDP
jgi:hypothetical protein